MRALNRRMRARRAWRVVRTAAVALALLMSIGASTAVASVQPPTPAQEGFVPVEQAGQPQEQLPAAPLVMGAYAVAWIAILVYLWSIWQRLGRVEREIAAVHRRVEARR